MAHARLAPSSAHRWLVCPGSIEQSAGIPNRTTDAAELGTACHWLAQMRLENQPWDTVPVVRILDQSPGAAEGATKDIAVTVEMLEWVEAATDWVLDYVQAHPGCHLTTETRLNPGNYFGVPDELWGTADVLVDVPGVELLIADFKFGTGHVDERENPQLTLYAIGAAERTGWSHPAYRLAVLQPRTSTGEGRDELVTRRELIQRAESMRSSVIAATRHNAPLVPSDEGCRWCPAAGRCSALQERALQLAMRQFADPRYITESELQLLLAEAKRIRIGLDAAEEYAEQRLSAGFALPGWKMVRARTNREWSDEAGARATLDMLDVPSGKYLTRPTLISPAQAEKLLGKGKAGALKPFITQREGAPTLAPESDPRPALPATLADRPGE